MRLLQILPFITFFLLFSSPIKAEEKAKNFKIVNHKHQSNKHQSNHHKKITKSADKKTNLKTENKNSDKNLDAIKSDQAPTILKEIKPEKIKPSNKSITQKLWQPISEQDIATLEKISLALQQKSYDEALAYANWLKKDEIDQDSQAENRDAVKVKPDFSDAVNDIILWNKFSSDVEGKNIYFSDISRFASDNLFYPNISEIKRNVEKVAIASKIPFQSSEQYFKSNPASDKEAKIYFLQSKVNFLQRFNGSQEEKFTLQKEIIQLISDIWIKENFSAQEEKIFLDKFQNQLNMIDHIKRIDRLLWDAKVADAKRIIDFVDDDYKKLFQAIIELQNSPKYIDNIILSVSRKLRTNENLFYRRIIWYKSKDKIDELLDLMLDLPEKLQYPERWWSLRRLYAREMLKKKNYKVAYLLTAKHSLSTNANDFWEAEWMSGWIALRFLNEAKVAYEHFDKLYKNVTQPVTLSRAAYWLGMAAQANGDKKQAIQWYKIAAKYPLFFYGQLGINKHRALDNLDAQYDIILPKDPDIMVADMKTISATKSVKVAYLLALMGDKKNAAKIFEYAVDNATTDGQIAVIMKVVNEIKDRQLDVRISRIAARHNVFFIKDKFQIVKEIPNDEYAPLVHAIVKQESGFAPIAVSQVGALGFMQLMPTTAKLVAKDIGIHYNKQKLATDVKYNVKIGTFYIKKLIDRFDGSEMLAIASYNAGPNATQRWINEYYDPRKEKDLDKVVDWIELISYSETRNYVQRIMENLIVYKYLMSRANYDNLQ
ncbi:MAG: lytic transglycosylase domain-containing protein [Rickettsiales bacterium]|nr:lytic transglycosylase domain-containing protein [Rickettsiales bacterium]